jgi:hypothetical protein
VFYPSRPFATFVFKDHQRPSEGNTNARGSHETHTDNVWSEETLLQEPHGAKVAMRTMCDAETATTYQDCGRNLGVAVFQLQELR